jgi:DNA-binding transcriptional regulator GbsR (MarR family)
LQNKFLIMSADKVYETLKVAGKPMKSAEISEASGLDKKEVDKAMKQLKTEGRIESPKVCFWQPKQN